MILESSQSLNKGNLQSCIENGIKNSHYSQDSKGN